MRRFQMWAMMFCVGGLMGSLLAQTTAPASTQKLPKPSAAISQIPAGAMGFLVVNNVEVTAGDIDKYLVEIGLDELLKETMPNGLLEFIKANVPLGSGFNSQGGFAVAMLNPETFGVDLPAVIKNAMDEKDITDVKLPFVVLMPGVSVEDVLPKLKEREKTQVGKFTQYVLPIGPMLVAEHDGYILLSPSDKALEAVIASDKGADTELTVQQKAMLARSDVGVQVNMKVSGPILSKVLTILEQEMAAKMKAASMPGDAEQPVHSTRADTASGMMLNSLKPYREMIAQLQGMTIIGRFGKTGVVFESLTDYVPDSPLGKMAASYKTSDKPLLGRLPNMTYALALGATGPTEKQPEMVKDMTKTYLQMYRDMFKQMGMGSIYSDQNIDKFIKLAEGFQQECTGMQMVIGGAPEGQGVVAAACVMECKDADKVKVLLADSTALVQEVITSLAAEHEGLKDVQVAYKKGEAPDSVDTIEFTMPALKDMSDEDKKQMSAILGEGELRLRVASPDKNTVVVTFGGNKAFLDEALKAAKDGGTLPKDKGIVEAMSYMPKNLAVIATLNVGGIFELVTRGTQAVGAGGGIPFNIAAQTPLALGAGMEGSMEHTVLYIPNDLVKEIVGTVKMFFTGMSRPMSTPPMPPAGGGESF